MKRRRILGVAVAICIVTLALYGCGKTDQNTETNHATPPQTDESDQVESAEGETETDPIMLTYSFMYDNTTKDFVRDTLISDGLDDETVMNFMQTVMQFTDAMGDMKGAVNGFTTVDTSEPFYDMNYIETTFGKKLGFNDQNCRLTAYSLFSSLVSLSDDSSFKYNDKSLYADLKILKTNKNQKLEGDDLKKYEALFASVKGETTSNQKILAEYIADTWENRGIEFMENRKIQLVTVMIQNQKEDSVYAGHAGVLFETEEGYLFIEKFAQYTPFVAEKFKTIDELKTYLLSEMVSSTDDGTVAPFVMLNNQII